MMNFEQRRQNASLSLPHPSGTVATHDCIKRRKSKASNYLRCLRPIPSSFPKMLYKDRIFHATFGETQRQKAQPHLERNERLGDSEPAF